MTLSVLKGRFPMQACASAQACIASAEVSTHWCRNVHSLVPKCLGAEVSWGQTVQCRNVFWTLVSSGQLGTGAEVSWVRSVRLRIVCVTVAPITQIETNHID